MAAAERPSIPSSRPLPTSYRNLLRQSPTLCLAHLLYPYRATASPTPSSRTISIVCISDTHNTQPAIPDGDLLLHAGNLTVGGSRAELQAQITWLASLPHQHKVVIAGNHDLLLDAAFLARSPSRVPDRGPLDWRGVTYLDNDTARLTFRNGRTLALYGCPWTPAFGRWAFQHPSTRAVWPGTVPRRVDVLLSHGPPRGFLDDGGRGCPQLRAEIVRARPSLAVCGHVHAGRGTARVRHDAFQSAHEGVVVDGRRGVWCALALLFWFVVGHLGRPFVRCCGAAQVTMLVNAAMVGPTMDGVDGEALVVSI